VSCVGRGIRLICSIRCTAGVRGPAAVRRRDPAIIPCFAAGTAIPESPGPLRRTRLQPHSVQPPAVPRPGTPCQSACAGCRQQDVKGYVAGCCEDQRRGGWPTVMPSFADQSTVFCARTARKSVLQQGRAMFASVEAPSRSVPAIIRLEGWLFSARPLRADTQP